MNADDPQSRVIYIPEQGLPILAPPQHRTVTEISDHEMEYLDLGVSSGYSFVSYHPTQRHPLHGEYKLNDYFANIYRGMGIRPSIIGPAYVVVSDHSRGSAGPASPDGIVNAAQPSAATMLHLRMLGDQIYREASERAQKISHRLSQ